MLSASKPNRYCVTVTREARALTKIHASTDGCSEGTKFNPQPSTAGNKRRIFKGVKEDKK